MNKIEKKHLRKKIRKCKKNTYRIFYHKQRDLVNFKISLQKMDAENPPVKMAMTTRPKVKKMFSWSDDSPSQIADGWVLIKVQIICFVLQYQRNFLLKNLLLMVDLIVQYTHIKKSIFNSNDDDRLIYYVNTYSCTWISKMIMTSFLLCSWKKKTAM